MEAPSWFIALPATTASTRWPLRRASERRSRTTIPAPSPQPMPSALSAKGLQRPSKAIPSWAANSANADGVDMIATPPASAIEHSRARSAWQARCSATRAEEHAVSTVTAGPSRPRV
ncbi:hypothetical protein Kisp01_35980 [Kineosporia sp. NBRC 101677]|nr:hypothetical protein Kisp01_35980 [Kineosporia sp. NBRC 101677]